MLPVCCFMLYRRTVWALIRTYGLWFLEIRKWLADQEHWSKNQHFVSWKAAIFNHIKRQQKVSGKEACKNANFEFFDLWNSIVVVEFWHVLWSKHVHFCLITWFMKVKTFWCIFLVFLCCNASRMVDGSKFD